MYVHMISMSPFIVRFWYIHISAILSNKSRDLASLKIIKKARTTLPHVNDLYKNLTEIKLCQGAIEHA